MRECDHAMTHWQDKVVFITGAGSGIGRALAVALAQRGAKLTVTDINGDAASQTAQACGGHARKLALDVRDAAAVAAAVDEAAEAGGRLDVIFNNAGIGIAGETHELDVAHFDRILDINVRGVVHGVMAAYPRMVAQGFGQIVNTASLAGLGPAPFFTPYAMTKHAVVGLTRHRAWVCGSTRFVLPRSRPRSSTPRTPPISRSRSGRPTLARC